MQPGRGQRQRRAGKLRPLRGVELIEKRQLAPANPVLRELLPRTLLLNQFRQYSVPQVALKCSEPEAAQSLRDNRNRAAIVVRALRQMIDDIASKRAKTRWRAFGPVAPGFAEQAFFFA